MRLNLLCGDNILNGFINIESNPNNITKPINESVSICSCSNLDSVAVDNSVEEIVVSQPINILDPDELYESFKHWVKKLKINGQIYLHFYDINAGARMIINDPNNHALYNSVFFSGFKCIMTTNIFENLTRSLKVSIDLQKKYNNIIEYTVRKG